MKIVVKIGTHALINQDETISFDMITNISRQISSLKKQGHAVTLVSSGAVAFGRDKMRKSHQREYSKDIAEQQFLATLGQPELIRAYINAFEQYDLVVSQVLLSRQDFHTAEHKNNIKSLFSRLINDQHTVPVINENDSVVIEGLQHQFTDNDELAGIVANYIKADKLILLTNVPGVFDKNPVETNAKLMPVIYAEDVLPTICTSKSEYGRGGMASKLQTAHKASASGIMAHIAKADTTDVILKIVAGDAIGTTILGKTNERSTEAATAS